MPAKLSDAQETCETCDWHQQADRLREQGVPDRLCREGATPCYSCTLSEQPTEHADGIYWIPRREFQPPFSERLPHNKFERAYLVQFLHENARSLGLNHGMSLCDHLCGGDRNVEISQETINALSAFAQYLGTNCGLAFMVEAERIAGRYLEHRDLDGEPEVGWDPEDLRRMEEANRNAGRAALAEHEKEDPK